MKNNLKIIEETGKRYNDIIFGDDYISKDVYKFQINLRNEIINKCISNKRFKNTLDLGCGTGFHLETLSKFSEKLIAVDMSFGALKESKKNIECDYIVCDINKLPFKDNTIDFIWIAGVLHHVPNDLKSLISNDLSARLVSAAKAMPSRRSRASIFSLTASQAANQRLLRP